MGNVADNKFTWAIKNFSSLKPQKLYSDPFVIDGCKWLLWANLMGVWSNRCPLYLEVADHNLLPSGWKRHARYRLSILNQTPGKKIQCKEQQQWFCCSSHVGKSKETLPLSKVKAKDSGFLVNGELKIVAEIHLLEVGESEETTQAVKRKKLDVVPASTHLLNQAMQQPIESVDINGFLVLPSQVDIARRVFEKYPDIALEFCPKDSHTRKGCMNSLLSLIETMCQSPQKLSNADLAQADIALTYVKDSGFKVDWLKKKLEEVKEKKKDEQTGVTRMQELEKELKDYSKNCSEMEAVLKKEKTKVLVATVFLEKEKAKVLAARVPLTLDDVI